MTAEDRERVRELLQNARPPMPEPGPRPPQPVLLLGGPANGQQLEVVDPGVNEIVVPDFTSELRPATPRDRRGQSPFAVEQTEVHSRNVSYYRVVPPYYGPGHRAVFTRSGHSEPEAAEWMP